MDTNAPRSITGIPAKTVFTVTDLSKCRTMSQHPDEYRLAKKSDGTLILQGAYGWNEGFTKFGYEWRDIPTVDYEELK